MAKEIPGGEPQPFQQIRPDRFAGEQSRVRKVPDINIIPSYFPVFPPEIIQQGLEKKRKILERFKQMEEQKVGGADGEFHELKP